MISVPISIPVKQDDDESIAKCVQHSPAARATLRAVRQFAWLEVGSVKVALSRPTSTPTGHTHRVLRQRKPLRLSNKSLFKNYF
jgi:hypothetical protein